MKEGECKTLLSYTPQAGVMLTGVRQVSFDSFDCFFDAFLPRKAEVIVAVLQLFECNCNQLGVGWSIGHVATNSIVLTQNSISEKCCDV